MSIVLFSLLLAIVWMIVMGEFSPLSLLIGFAISYFLVAIAWGGEDSFRYYRRFSRTISFLIFFIKELIVANLRMAWYTLTPIGKLRTGILSIEIEEMSDLEVTVLGCLITLTPGSLTLDVSDDKKVLFVHFMHIEDPDRLRREIQHGFAPRLMEVMR